MLNLTQQSCNFAQCLNPISSVSTERWHHWCDCQFGQARKLCSAHRSEVVPPSVVLDLTKHRTWDPWAQGDLAQRRDEEIENLPEAARLATVREDARFVRTVSLGQFCMTRSEVGVCTATQVYAENIHILETSLTPTTKDQLGSISLDVISHRKERTCTV